MNRDGKVVVEAGAFENGYADLKGGALPQLDTLAAKLRKSGRNVQYARTRVFSSRTGATGGGDLPPGGTAPAFAEDRFGHTAADASEIYNVEMSLRRAEAVKCYLSGKGIDPHRVKTEGRGATEPVASNGTARGRELNRRVEVCVNDPD